MRAQNLNEANAKPTKAFFTGMLTRDIELKDAVLDLLDNCVDGLMRQTKGKYLDKDRPYKGHWASITFAVDHFVIEDNCGGISKKLARQSAFRMGRTDSDRGKDGKLATVGTYGIGMKRAIFKMGRSASITSTTADESFEVTIPKQWFEDDDNWIFSIHDVPRHRSPAGLRLEIRNLLPAVAQQFFPGKNFDQEFYKVVAEQFALIIAKGFEVKINGTRVKPKVFRYRSVTLKNYQSGIAPFLFRAVIEDVIIDLNVGFYKPVPDDSDLDEDDDAEGTSSADEAGWTVICNDRVILANDKSFATGWGVSGVPQYHNQFISIAGTVRFTSTDASKLPLTTTKRGVDLNNDIYLRVRDKMIEGTKFFTSYTNKIKKIGKEEKIELFRSIGAINLKELDEVDKDKSIHWKADRALSGKTFKPSLPELNANRLRVVRFSKSKEDIEELRNFLFDDEDATASEIGSACFDRVLTEARET